MDDDLRIVSLLNRHYIADGIYIYNFVNSLVGTYNEEYESFIDENGKEYFYIQSMDESYGESPYVVAGETSFAELKKKYLKDLKELNLQDSEEAFQHLVTLYDIENENNMYIVKYDPEGKKSVYQVNVEDLVNSFQKALNDGTENEEDEKSFHEEALDLIKTINDCIYTKEDLKELKNSISSNKKDMVEVLKVISDKLKDDNYKVVKKPKKESIKEEKKDLPPKEEINEETLDDLIDIDGITEGIKKTVIAQDEHVRRIVVEVARMILNRKKRSGILITGSTGIGKTLIMKKLAEYLDRPFLEIDSTQITIPGYTGKNIEQCLYELLKDCNFDKNKAERAIVYFDEIDKKGSENKSDVSGKGVLNVLLKFLDGTSYEACESSQSPQTISINTSKMIVIASGAFNDVYKKQRRALGFTAKNEEEKKEEPSVSDFVEKAMMTDEFMGRMPIVVHLDDLSDDNLIRIMKESDASPTKYEVENFKKINCELLFTEDAFKKLASVAGKKNIGARGLNGLVSNVTFRPFDYAYRNRGKVKSITITDETIDDSSKFKVRELKNNGRKEVRG